MLNNRKDIIDAKLPLLLLAPDNSWELIVALEKIAADHYQGLFVRIKNDQLEGRELSIHEAPFHVAEDIWELQYGVQVMTLDHYTLRNHPASTAWQQWQQQQ